MSKYMLGKVWDEKMSIPKHQRRSSEYCGRYRADAIPSTDGRTDGGTDEQCELLPEGGGGWGVGYNDNVDSVPVK